MKGLVAEKGGKRNNGKGWTRSARCFPPPPPPSCLAVVDWGGGRSGGSHCSGGRGNNRAGVSWHTGLFRSTANDGGVTGCVASPPCAVATAAVSVRASSAAIEHSTGASAQFLFRLPFLPSHSVPSISLSFCPSLSPPCSSFPQASQNYEGAANTFPPLSLSL